LVALDGGLRPYPLRFHVKQAGADAKLIQHGPLGVAYHRRHPISTVPVARITAHATVPSSNFVSLEIPNISPENLEVIMSEITNDGFYRSMMNDIIKAHDQVEEINQRISRFSSMIAWIVLSELFVLIIAFSSYLFHYLYTIRKSMATHLKLNTRKALYRFINNYLQNLKLNQAKL
jgi:hypothetical protein